MRSVTYLKALKNKYTLLNLLVNIIAVTSPLMTFPQVYLIFNSKNADGVSTISWIAFTFTSVVWLCYGITNKQKPIIINSTFGGILSFLVVIGTLLY